MLLEATITEGGEKPRGIVRMIVAAIKAYLVIQSLLQSAASHRLLVYMLENGSVSDTHNVLTMCASACIEASKLTRLVSTRTASRSRAGLS